MSSTTRLLVKLRPGASLDPARHRNLRPLYPERIRREREYASAPVWYIADLLDVDPSPWDAAHSQVRNASELGLRESDIICAEPDLSQRFLYRNVPLEGNPPSGPHFAWHLDDDYSQLRTGRQSVLFSDPRTRIAHIDTGYDPTHASCPKNILHALERNFFDANHPYSAVDPNNGYPFEQSGHGTGTLALLAGNKVAQCGGDYLGGAPEADIVPIRIADSVILLWTSTLAQAIHYAVDQNCDVASISLGGLPSFTWCEEVNNAYEAGLCIVAAAGDCFGGLPTHYVIYPAHFRRTIAVCGVMADSAPYYDFPPWTVEGNWGPESAMTAALAAWTPHTPWAQIATNIDISEEGAGTSCAVPQVAAAVALWLEKNKANLNRDWTRVEAVRQALFNAADHVDPEHFGRGILRAADALAVAPVGAPPKAQPDTASFAFLESITESGNSSTREQMMFHLEMTQRWVLSSKLQQIIPEPMNRPSHASLREFVNALIDDPQISATLRRSLKDRNKKPVGRRSRDVDPR